MNDPADSADSVQPPSAAPRSAASRRTRRLIIDAAIETLGQRQSAALGEIADAAGVSRSTLHRQFADRTALLSAVDDECRHRFDDASRRAQVFTGTGLEAIGRLAQEYLDLGPVLSLIFADNALIDPDNWEDVEERDGSGGSDELNGGTGLAAIIERGHHDGSIDAALPTPWIVTTLWVLLFGAWQVQSSGAARHEVSALLARTLIGALGHRT
ncbi:TetR/AcrR family transcriptional regulator [Microlunatus soli]|uniref:DNA-binding transcriptional regulator, AcrR family n=1 Tax=Microlunatus soli TaxID=630515 RepID=A0A1H1T9L8_9ACTN|nr:TetR/AcrR family transcriptional regulator [Microlunatus soli]SDS56716.1 DNA-binding transcriptional regulator, AcrR family [Microlunatus soli]